MDWVNIIGWIGTVGFLTALGLYIRYQIVREEGDDSETWWPF